MGVCNVVLMMDIEISCKGRCEKLSYLLDHVSHIVLSISYFKLQNKTEGKMGN